MIVQQINHIVHALLTLRLHLLLMKRSDILVVKTLHNAPISIARDSIVELYKLLVIYSMFLTAFVGHSANVRSADTKAGLQVVYCVQS